MAFGHFKNLAKRTASDKVSRNKSFNITKNPKYGGYQGGLASMVYKLFEKKSSKLTKMDNYLLRIAPTSY